MFSGLRTNSIFYVLDKSNEPTLQIGQVVSVSNPQPKFPTYQPGQFSPQPMESVVDVRVKLTDGEMDFKQLPSNGQIANSGSLVVSESREAMSAEVEAMLRQSRQIIDRVDYHRSVVTSCESMLAQLNPQIAEKKEQEQKISQLETKMSGIEGTLSNIQGMLAQALKPKQ